MSKSSLTLMGLSIAATLFPNPALACQKGDQACYFYGATIANFWFNGAQAEKAGNFPNAVHNYQLALVASQQFTNPRLSPDRNFLLRKCAVGASSARLSGAKAGLAYINQYGRTDSTITLALQESQRQFRADLHQQDLVRPFK
ncbi:MAG: hypothetical protein WCO45_01370 [Pseudanabaena sp. ELA607]|jgi:hypothetical protein